MLPRLAIGCKRVANRRPAVLRELTNLLFDTGSGNNAKEMKRTTTCHS